jgi:hypothetical protein
MPESVSKGAAALPLEDDEEESLKAMQGGGQLRSESDWIRLFPGKINITVVKGGGTDPV